MKTSGLIQIAFAICLPLPSTVLPNAYADETPPAPYNIDVLKVAADEFVACVSAHAMDTGITSFDGGKSTLALIETTCSHATLAFVAECSKIKVAADGSPRDAGSCLLELGIISQSALKLYGR